MWVTQECAWAFGFLDHKPILFLWTQDPFRSSCVCFFPPPFRKRSQSLVHWNIGLTKIWHNSSFFQQEHYSVKAHLLAYPHFTVMWYFICVDFKIELNVLFWLWSSACSLSNELGKIGKYIAQTENHSIQRNLLTFCSMSCQNFFPLAHIFLHTHFGMRWNKLKISWDRQY